MKRFRKRYIAAAAGLMGGAAILLSAGKADFSVGKNLEVFFNLFREVNAYYVDEADPDRLMKDAAAGMLGRLDPYTEFLSESDMENFEIMTTGKYGGIGSLIRKKGDYVIVAQPYKGFAADRAGLKIGDRILSVDGKEMKGADPTTVSNLMKGDPGTTLKLRVERFADGRVEEVTVKRERIAISGVPYYGMVDDSVGYIAHGDFSEDCSADVKRALLELKGQGMKALVFDLRGNGGGIMQEAVKIVGMFVPKGTEVVSIRGKNREVDAAYRTSAEPVDDSIRIAVLINRGSASASEIVAGSLQDVDRAVLVGERSFGKGLVQTTRPVGYNAYVKLTTAKYYIPSGRCIQAIDYSHRNEDGSVGYVPDSLIREFQTRNGRKVYDGGGIMPDLRVEAPYVSLFTMNLYGKGYIEDFAAEYVKKHGFRPVDVDRFRLSDADYADFVAFMQDKEVEVDSETRALLEELEKTAAREKYADRIASELESIRRKIEADKNQELETFRDEISRLIEDDVILYFHYAQGVIRHKLREDSVLDEAVKVLGDEARYASILESRDTPKK